MVSSLKTLKPVIYYPIITVSHCATTVTKCCIHLL